MAAPVDVATSDGIRAASRYPQSVNIATTPNTLSALDDAAPLLVVVDPMSTGATLASAAIARSMRVVCVWSDVCPDNLKSFVAEGTSVAYAGIVNHTGDLDATIEAIRCLGTIGEVCVGSEPGVELADALAHALSLRGNDVSQSAMRRDKFAQSEAIRAKGLAAAHQALVSTLDGVDNFLAAHCDPFTKAVVKPVDGAASEGVTICDSADQVRAAFLALQGTTNVFGRDNAKVLLMEFLGGDEYVVDTVSRDGEHKVVAIWKYMKRPCNGVANCWFGQRLLPIDAEPHLPQFEAYIYGVLDAIGITNGAVHSEVKFDGSTPSKAKRGPVLIECNCRLHGIEGSWAPIVERCLGYSQVSALLDAYYEPTAFAALPPHPATEAQATAFGAQIGVRSMVEGEVTRVNQARIEEIRSVASYVSENVAWSGLQPGCRIAKTVDVVTLCGQISLVHASQAQLEADMARVQEVIDAGLFEVEVAPLALLGWRRLAMGLAIGAAVVAVAAASFAI